MRTGIGTPRSQKTPYFMVAISLIKDCFVGHSCPALWLLPAATARATSSPRASTARGRSNHSLGWAVFGTLGKYVDGSCSRHSDVQKGLMAFKGLRKRGEIRLFAELEANRRLLHPELLDALG
jgi:hypothetical protein